MSIRTHCCAAVESRSVRIRHNETLIVKHRDYYADRTYNKSHIFKLVYMTRKTVRTIYPIRSRNKWWFASSFVAYAANKPRYDDERVYTQLLYIYIIYHTYIMFEYIVIYSPKRRRFTPLAERPQWNCGASSIYYTPAITNTHNNTWTFIFIEDSDTWTKVDVALLGTMSENMTRERQITLLYYTFLECLVIFAYTRIYTCILCIILYYIAVQVLVIQKKPSYFVF